MPVEVVSSSAEATEAVAARLARRLRLGDVVTVAGELGAGKTTFVRGACRALGVTDPVTSPTFTIGHRYRGSMDVSHLDLYRFEGSRLPSGGISSRISTMPSSSSSGPKRVAARCPRRGHGRARPSRPDDPTDQARRRRRRAARRDPSPVLILAFDTATDVRPRARSSTTARCSASAAPSHEDACSRTSTRCCVRQGLHAGDIEALAVGTGPGSFTATRIGLAVGRGLGLSLGLPAAGVSTLDAIAAGAPGAHAGDRCQRGEIFVPGPRALRPDALELAAGTVCVGDGAVKLPRAARTSWLRRSAGRRRRHVPRARFHAALADRVRVRGRDDADLCPGSRRRPGALVKVELRTLGGSISRRSRRSSVSRIRPHGRARCLRRARQAELALSRRLRPGQRPGRLPDRLALRRRLARDEHRCRRRATDAVVSRAPCSGGCSW